MNLRSKIPHHRAFFRLFGLMGSVLLLFSQPSRVYSAPQDLVIQVFPAALELGVGETGRAQVVVRNPTDQIVSNLTLSWINNHGFEVASESDTIRELPGYSEAVWDLEVRQTEQALDSGKVNLRVDYKWTDNSAPDSKPVSRVQFAELEVTTPTVESVGDVASVEVKSTLTALNEQRPGIIYLIIENKGGVPLNIGSIQLRKPKDVDVTPLSSNEDDADSLAPGEKRDIAYQVTAAKVVQPGRHVLLFEIELTWENGGRVQAGTLIASHELDLGIFGESQILTLLGIPAFFLLPGFLMIVAFRLLWSRGKTKEEAATFPLPAASSEFWFVAISLSLLMALLYPWVTLWILGTSGNYLTAYGLEDVLNLWFGSIFLAVISYILYFGIKRIVALTRQRQIAQRTPSTKDDQWETVRKLKRQNLTLKRDRVSIKIRDVKYSVFLLQEKIGGDQDFHWVAPLILITNRETLEEDLVESIYNILGVDGDIDDFLQLTETLILTWEAGWPLPGPYRVPKGDIEKFDKPDMMVEFA